MTAVVETPDGKVIRELAHGKDLEEGDQELDWAPDNSMAPGDYQIRLTVMATYSSRERVSKELVESFSYQK